MQNNYADIILDITHGSVDRPFTYAVPEQMKAEIRPGMPVRVPFGAGNRLRAGYVIALHEEAPEYSGAVKEIAGAAEEQVSAGESLIALAVWMHEHYGCMLNQAMRTVMPVRSRTARRAERTVVSDLSPEELRDCAEKAGKKRQTARARLALALASSGGRMPYGRALAELKGSAAPLRAMEQEGILRVTESGSGDGEAGLPGRQVTLNREQEEAVRRFRGDLRQGRRETYLLFGITGSGKTEVYAEMIREVLQRGKQAILLIPEISLTFQTVSRLERIFGDRVAIIHSRLSKGERYEQFRRAAEGEADIMIGPRSAVFAPFDRLGLIVVDEEHDGAYKNDTVPRYDTRDVAEKRAEMAGASVVLGSATPSADTWDRVEKGNCVLLELKERAVPGARTAEVHVADLRRELTEGNRSVFSRKLAELMRDRLNKGEQTILFMNRRGYSNFISCRSCGSAIRCPHCDVTLTLHSGGTLICHYCGYRIPQPDRCPECGSPYIAGFGTGTQKLETLTGKMFPEARILRMDADAAAGKNSGRDILRDFAAGKADILIGTQMVVKGHDFPRVTLVGIMAADTELYVSDYRSAERTFQLLTQAAGRAGRGERRGDVVIQTYRPEHYAVRAAAEQNYGLFIRSEMAFREAAGYPPALHLLTLQISALDEGVLERTAEILGRVLLAEAGSSGALVIGPVNAAVYKVHDYFRKLIYLKHSSYDILLKIKSRAEERLGGKIPQGVSLLSDFA